MLAYASETPAPVIPTAPNDAEAKKIAWSVPDPSFLSSLSNMSLPSSLATKRAVTVYIVDNLTSSEDNDFGKFG